MYEQIEKYLYKIITLANNDNPIWNIEKKQLNKSPHWNYIDGCMMNSLIELYKITQDSQYLNFVEKYISDFIEDNGTIKTYDSQKYNLDDVCEGRVLFTLYEYTKKEKYRLAIQKIYQQLLTQPRTKEGNFWHKLIYPNQVWLDGLYMAMPFYVLYNNYYHTNKNEDVINQYLNIRKLMYDNKTGLYYHGYDSSKSIFWANIQTGLSSNFWLRSIGWFFTSLVDVYELLINQQQKEIIKQLIIELTYNICQYQDKETYLFYQVVDKGNLAGNYFESSGNAMIAYCLLKAARLGILDEKMKKRGKLIFDNLCKYNTRIENENFILGNICLVAGLGPSDNLRRDGSFDYYISEPIVENDGKGMAALIMSYIELKRNGYE